MLANTQSNMPLNKIGTFSRFRKKVPFLAEISDVRGTVKIIAGHEIEFGLF